MNEPKKTKEMEAGMKKAMLCALAAALFLKTLCFDFVMAEGRSMSPAIEPGAILLVLRAAYGLRLPWARGYLLRWGCPREGSVVVFTTPQGALAVKRCAAVVGENDCFIALGDNRGESFDSRFYGPVPVDRIVGKVWGK